MFSLSLAGHLMAQDSSADFTLVSILSSCNFDHEFSKLSEMTDCCISTVLVLANLANGNFHHM